VKLLGLPPAHVIGHLEVLWHVAYESDSAIIGTPDDVELAAEWDGQPGTLFASLRDAGGDGRAGFIECANEEANLWQVHDLLDHAPTYVKDRQRKKLGRANKPRPGKSRKVQENPGKSTLEQHNTTQHNTTNEKQQNTSGGEIAADCVECVSGLQNAGTPIRPRTPPEFDNELMVVWDRLDAVAQASGAFSAKLGLTQARRYALRRALDEIGGDADRLVAGFRWCLTATAAEFVRDNWRGIDTYLAADKTMGYVEASEAPNAWRKPGDRAGPKVESKLERMKREAAEAEAKR